MGGRTGHGGGISGGRGMVGIHAFIPKMHLIPALVPGAATCRGDKVPMTDNNVNVQYI